MILLKSGDYTIKTAIPSGGKAGKGHNKTSTIQLFRDNQMIAHFRYDVGDSTSLRLAKAKAVARLVDLVSVEELKEYDN